MHSANILSTIDVLLTARASGQPTDGRRWASAVGTAKIAYDVQQQVAERLRWFEPGKPQHWKSGGPSREAALTHAMLPPDGIWPSPASTSRAFSMRGIEAEIALRLSAPVDAARAASLDHASASALVDAMTVSIEVVDSRWTQGLDAPALLKLADLQSHGALVLGNWVAFDASRDWSTQICRVRIADAPEQVFCGTHALRDPAWVLPALLKHATRDGKVLPSGSVVTTGTWCGILQARPGDSVSALFDGVGEARVSFTA